MNSVSRLTKIFRPNQNSNSQDPLDAVSHGWDDLDHESKLKRPAAHSAHGRPNNDLTERNGNSQIDHSSLIDRVGCMPRGHPLPMLDTVLHGMPEELEGLRFILPDQMAFISILPDKLASLKKTFMALKITCVSSDLHKQYTAFCSDFGPVNLSIVHRFTRAMASKLARLSETGSILLYCIEPTFESVANASFLLGAFLVLHAGLPPAQANSKCVCKYVCSSLRSYMCISAATSH
jgi:hypothetical protein